MDVKADDMWSFYGTNINVDPLTRNCYYIYFGLMLGFAIVSYFGIQALTDGFTFNPRARPHWKKPDKKPQKPLIVNNQPLQTANVPAINNTQPQTLTAPQVVVQQPIPVIVVK
ncbi:hypothetical protein M3Y94_00218600 [Aphelenchoides besseyi]|nr:hypothetical protein M3Y94_00218600 [Aphelenchoides besseyi]KAI6236553.1 hypothetical protein M3Y95_00169900 [Aphelenchoides besseyi]